MKDAIFISTLTLLASATALAHGGRGGECGRHGQSARFERADADGDGRLSRDEWAAKSLARLDALDSNGDGVVTNPEATAHCERMKADRFAAIDANEDGSISRDEASRMPERRFAAMDADGDGLISQREFEGAGRRGAGCSRGHLFDKLDADGDGTITRAEARAASDARFAKLDVDGDGALDRGELRKGKKRHMRHGKGERRR